VPLTTLTLVAAMVSNLTVAPDKKLVPLMLTDVPPAVLPLCGVIALTVGAGLVCGGGSPDAVPAALEPTVMPHPVSPRITAAQIIRRRILRNLTIRPFTTTDR